MIRPRIISVSRRTDIPAFYHKWFFNRIEKGFVHVKKKIHSKIVKKVSLLPDHVICFVFWTRNPQMMLEKLDILDHKGFNYYFQFTLTPYGREIEPGLPDHDSLVNTFRAVSEKIGKQKIIWRYDPILFSSSIGLEYHKEKFEQLAEKLCRYTGRCTISFIDTYGISKKNRDRLQLKRIDTADMEHLGREIAQVGRKLDLTVETCAEKIDLSGYGIHPAKCVDDDLIKKITGKDMTLSKDPSQRKLCRCVQSIDIGTDETCLHGCRYCYATKSHAAARRNSRLHDQNSSGLIGKE